MAAVESVPHYSQTPDWQSLLTHAHDARMPLFSAQEFDSWRLFHGYEEGCAGITIEKFGEFAVIDYKHDIRAQLP
jgi:23S rRNA G2069 N7-methylase RlmK/C1962 C5-methylase RlmI